MVEYAPNLKERRSEPPTDSGPGKWVVFRRWPFIAVGLVVLAVAVEWGGDGLAADGGMELYLLSWATLTSVLWWLFERMVSGFFLVCLPLAVS